MSARPQTPIPHRPPQEKDGGKKSFQRYMFLSRQNYMLKLVWFYWRNVTLETKLIALR